MYNVIVRSRVRRLWLRVGEGDYMPAISMASPKVYFHFMGTTALSQRSATRDEFQTWFEDLFHRFPGLKIKLLDVTSHGWPWATTIAVRLAITAPLADGTTYHNDAMQWMKLRWGKLILDEVLEDTMALDLACKIQEAHSPGRMNLSGE